MWFSDCLHFTRREEDPRRRNNFICLVWIHITEISVLVVSKSEKVRERISIGARQKQKFNLGLSALAIPSIFHSRIITIICSWKRYTKWPLLSWLASERPAALFSWFVPSTRIFLAKDDLLHVVTIFLVLGFSYLSDRKILALRDK